MSPNFSSGKMKEMVQLMEWCANHATDYLKRKCDKNGGVFNAKEWVVLKCYDSYQIEGLYLEGWIETYKALVHKSVLDS